MSTMEEKRTAVETWRLICADWYNASAHVVVTLNSGVQYSGRVARHPTKMLGNLIDLNLSGGAKVSIDAAEIAAIEAQP